MKVYYGTQVLKQDNKIKTMYPNYILEFRSMYPHFLQTYLGA